MQVCLRLMKSDAWRMVIYGVGLQVETVLSMGNFEHGVGLQVATVLNNFNNFLNLVCFIYIIQGLLKYL